MGFKEKLNKVLIFLRKYTSAFLCGLSIVILVLGLIIALIMHASGLTHSIIIFTAVTTFIVGYILSISLNRFKFSTIEFITRLFISFLVFLYFLLNLILNIMRQQNL